MSVAAGRGTLPLHGGEHLSNHRDGRGPDENHEDAGEDEDHQRENQLHRGFGRLFLRQSRIDSEVRQYSESMFLRRSLFATSRRTGILILISLFERRVDIVILDDPPGHLTVVEPGLHCRHRLYFFRMQDTFHRSAVGVTANDDVLDAEHYNGIFNRR